MSEITFTYTPENYPLKIEEINNCVDSDGKKLFLVKTSLKDILNTSNFIELVDNFQSEILGTHNLIAWFEDVEITINRKIDDDFLMLNLCARVQG